MEVHPYRIQPIKGVNCGLIPYSAYPIGFDGFVDYSADLRLCYRSERSNSVFIFKTFGMSSKLRVCSNYLIFRAWVLLLKQTNISDVFKIVSRGVDKR